MYRALTFTLLFVTWLVFSGFFDVFHVSLGILSCALVTWWSSDFLFENRSSDLGLRLRQAARLPGYLIWLMGQIVVANIHVLKLAFAPDLKNRIQPQLVRFKTGLGSDFEKFILAQSITLTPGTVTLQIEGDEFLIHAISEEAADGLTGPMAERVRRVFAD